MPQLLGTLSIGSAAAPRELRPCTPLKDYMSSPRKKLWTPFDGRRHRTLAAALPQRSLQINKMEVGPELSLTVIDERCEKYCCDCCCCCYWQRPEDRILTGSQPQTQASNMNHVLSDSSGITSSSSSSSSSWYHWINNRKRKTLLHHVHCRYIENLYSLRTRYIR